MAPSSRRGRGENVASMAWGARNLISTQVSTAETIGDVTMSCKYSKLETEGPDFESRVQGCVEFNQRARFSTPSSRRSYGDNITSMAWGA